MGTQEVRIFPNKSYISFDRGDYGTEFINFDIGVHEPQLFFDIADFYGGGSMYKYNSPEEVVSVTNKALDEIEIILPYFLGGIQRAVEKSSK